MITQLKDKFETATKRSVKVLVLTVLPKSWTIRKVQEEFGASNYMVRKAKELVRKRESYQLQIQNQAILYQQKPEILFRASLNMMI